MSPFERLLNLLPPDQRVGAALDFENLSIDPHGPIYAFYATILHAMDAKLDERLTTTDAKVQQLAAQQAQDTAINLKAVRQEVGALSGKTLWRRIITSRIVGGIILAIVSTACVLYAANLHISAKLQTVSKLEAEQAAMIRELSEKNSILGNLENPKGIVDFATASLRAAEASNKTAATIAGLAAMLRTPDAIAGIRDGKLTLKFRPEHIEVTEELNGFVRITIHDDMEPILGIESHLKDAEKALLPNQQQNPK